VQGPGDPDPLAGVGVAHPRPIPEPGGGGLDGYVLLSAGGAAAVHPGQVPQPNAFQPLDEPAQHQHPLGRFRVGEPGRVLGGQLIHRCRKQPEPARLRHRIYVRVHARNLSHPALGTRSDRQIVNNFLA
jgi:hypothetical protein